jgi:hypothetical protein
MTVLSEFILKATFAWLIGEVSLNPALVLQDIHPIMVVSTLALYLTMT